MARSVFLAGVFVSSLALAQGAVPTVVNFSARLTDSGAPVSAQRNFVFKLFLTPAGGSELWSETRSMLQVTNGTVNVDLGASTPLTDTVLDGRALWLEVTVDGTVLTPRMQLNSVPYALRSTVANRIGALTEPDLQRRVTATCPAGTAIRVINADGTVTCQASATVADAGVTITSVTAGPGLTGGGATGDLTLGVNFAGTGTANTVSRSDHTHSGFLPLGATLACPSGERVLRIDGATGSVICSGVGTVSSVVAGTGLTGGTITSSGTIGLAATVQNWTNQPSCAPGSALRTVSSTGVATCETFPTQLSPAMGGGLSVTSGGAIGLVTAGCPSGATMRFNGSQWGCIQDVISISAAPDSGVVISTGNGPNAVVGLAPTVPNWTTPPSCPPNTSLRGIGLNGAPTCVAPAPADSYFNLSYSNGSQFAHIWVSCLSTNCTIPVPGGYAFGSSSGTVSVSRSSPGVYSVSIPWVSSGVPQVSAYSGNGSTFCKIANWGSTTVNVNCFDLLP